MAGYVYVGRRRHRVRMAIYQVLTLGIYGRVWCYKVLHEIDGHEALFLDRRWYLPLLFLPFLGPWIVKRKVIRLIGRMVPHDVTGPAFHGARLTLLALVPILPFFIVYAQGFLNHHWSIHTKEEELRLKTDQLAEARRSRSKAAQERVKELEEDVAMRSKELEELKGAALAIRDAKAFARAARRERRVPPDAPSRGSVRKLVRLPKLRRRREAPDRPGESAAGSAPEREAPPAEADAEKPKRGFFRFGRKKADPSVEPSPDEPVAADEAPIEAPTPSRAKPKSSKRR